MQQLDIRCFLALLTAPTNAPHRMCSILKPSANTLVDNIQRSTEKAVLALKNANEARFWQANKKRQACHLQIHDKVPISTKNRPSNEGSGTRKLNL